MNDQAPDGIAAAAARDYGWTQDDIVVSSASDLDRPGCTFYRATNAGRAGSFPADYAQLGDGRLLSAKTADTKAAATLLQTCGEGAPASWWAEVVARYSGKVGGVVVGESGAASAIRRIRKAGADYAPPRLAHAGATTTVNFFVMHYERDTAAQVTASLSGATLAVEVRELRAQ